MGCGQLIKESDEEAIRRIGEEGISQHYVKGERVLVSATTIGLGHRASSPSSGFYLIEDSRAGTTAGDSLNGDIGKV